MARAVKTDAGLGLIEVMMAAMILTVSLMAVAMTMVQGMSAMFITQDQLIAKQKARETLESVFTARSTQGITFAQLQNDTVTGGIFRSGYQPIRLMGNDGIANTSDDSSTIESIVFPGPDGNLGNGDDVTRTLTTLERRITISNVLLPNNAVDPDIRLVTVDVRFQINRVWRTVTVSSYISRFA